MSLPCIRLEGSLGELRAKDGLLPLDGDIVAWVVLHSETVLNLVGVVAILTV